MDALEPQIPQGPEMVIKIILGLVALLALAYLGGHPVVRSLERRLRIAQVVTAGFPFLALGIVLALPGVGILTDSVLQELFPVLRFGLGWIGFSVGFRLDVRGLDDLPAGSARAVGFATALPFVFVVAAASLLLAASSDWSQLSFSNPVFLRDALVLGTAGAMTAQQASRLLGSVPRQAKNLLRLEELAGIVGLTFIAAYFRPSGSEVGWQLPGTAWLFLTVGLGGVVGVLAYVILRRPASGSESTLLLLGSVAFAAGIASSLFLSPVVVCFVAGVLLANMPGSYKSGLKDVLGRLERPIYLLFLVIVGATWEVGDWRGWILLPFFVGARLAGKWLAEVLVGRTTAVDLGDDHWAVRRAPLGQLSIAIVVSAQMLFPQGAMPILETAVIGGAILTEILVQLLARGGQRAGSDERRMALELEP